MKVHLRFYDNLNTSLPSAHQHHEVTLQTFQPTTIASALESLGISYSVVNLILVNGDSRPFTYVLQDHDCVDVYPPFEERGSEASDPHQINSADRFLAG